MPTKHEPDFHDVIRKSAIFLNTVGMRLSPELLIQELFREVFFGKSPSAVDVALTPEGVIPGTTEQFFDEKEKAVLYAFRGRRKQRPQSKADNFYAPAYPTLARGGWLRSNAERVVKYQLFAGPLGIHLAGKDSTVTTEAVKVIMEALLGNRRATSGDVAGKEFFSSALKSAPLKGDRDTWEQNVRGMLDEAPLGFFDDDEFASRIYHDFIGICKLEKNIPRLQWLDILMTFLRLALPSWYIAQSKLTVILRDCVVGAIDRGHVPDAGDLQGLLRERFRGLFHPSEVPTLEPNDHVSKYIKARIELNLALDLIVNEARVEGVDGRVLSFSAVNSGLIPVEALLARLKASRQSVLSHIGNDLTLRRYLTRKGELWSAWSDPLKKGQGKNFEEFLRVLYKGTEGDDSGGYLLSRIGGRGFLVFPGHQLAKTMVLLAAIERNRVNPGRLLINDVERQFSSYGIEFGLVAGARPHLLSLLSELGLLKGSPDAGEYSEVRTPYNL